MTRTTSTASDTRDAADEAICAGLFPEGCTQTTLEMVLLANPEVKDQASDTSDPVRVAASATEAFVNASALLRTAVRVRMSTGVSASDVRASVAKCKGIDLVRLFGVPAEPQAVAEVLFRERERVVYWYSIQ